MENIKNIRSKTKMSQSEFANRFGIPVRTLQKWEQGDSDPLPYLISLIQDEISMEEFLDISKYKFESKNKFKPVIIDKFKNIEKIHPIQQQRVADIIAELKKYNEVRKIMVFGSSVTPKCNFESDIDIYVELSKDINVKTFNVDCPVDFWTNYSVEQPFLDEINRKGVLVYGR